FGGRTGGANDNQWIDDLTGNEWVESFLPPDQSNAEANQTVKFVVTSDRPDLFSDQPSITANGTLCYTPAPNACGTAVVTVTAMGDGGKVAICGGSDMSAPTNFLIQIACQPDCPVVCGSLAVSVMQDSAGVSFQLPVCDPDGDVLTFGISQGAAHGTVV